MIHHVVYLQLNYDVGNAELEELVRASRTWLLKIPEVLSVRSGRNIDSEIQWQFFYSFEVESLEKLRLVKEDAFYLKLMESYIKPFANQSFEMDFELDPSRDLKYS
jgi:hypothetical protein